MENVIALIIVGLIVAFVLAPVIIAIFTVGGTVVAVSKFAVEAAKETHK